MRASFWLGMIGALITCGGIAAGGLAQACTLDQKPSASADGHLAGINRSTPTTQEQLAAWSYFAFPRPFQVGTTVVLTEDRREVARTLVPSAMRQPWGWLFGDGSSATGWTVRHAYTRPGPLRISVYAYDPAIGRWTLFDQVTITISA